MSDNHDPKDEISVNKKPKIKPGKKKADLKVVKESRISPTVFTLTKKNREYIDYYRNSTHASYTRLVNCALDIARTTNAFENIEVKMPKAVLKAQALLEKWHSVISTKKKSGRTAKTVNE